MIHVIATLKVKPGARDQLLEEFKKLVPQVLNEQGCIEYGVAVDLETGLSSQIKNGLDTVIVVEKWKDLDALDLHSKASHMNTYREKVKDILLTTQLQILQPI